MLLNTGVWTKWTKPKIILLSLLIGLPGSMFLARMVLTPVAATAGATRDNYIAAELRAELQRLYQNRHVYPTSLDKIWNDPEFQQILKTSLISEDRREIFSYRSTGTTYEFTFTNGAHLVIERGLNGVPSRESVKLEAHSE
jgi:hypothetical protein